MLNKQICAVAFAVVVGFVIHKTFKTKMFQIPDLPPLSPELQGWIDYVERYPTLEDDPRMKRALEILKQDQQDHPE